MKIERAKVIDAKSLTDLTMRSKGYWNYSAEQLEKWRDDLTINEKYILNNQVMILREKERIAGYYAVIKLHEHIAKLDNLFIEPGHIGKGLGKLLINHCVSLLKENGFKKVIVDSDPHAQIFYEKKGFVVVGELKSTIKDRFLPIMELDLAG